MIKIDQFTLQLHELAQKKMSSLKVNKNENIMIISLNNY